MNKEIIYNNIINSFNENRNSHAFLMETNNIEQCLNDIKNIIKNINCENIHKDNCDCNICTTIDKETNPDVIIIKPDGKEIKKEQILDLMNRFSTKPLINKYSVYIIVNAEKMNISSANKILKFLEEPEGKIIGFLITDRLQSVIPTIRSRCEIYNYQFESKKLLDLLELTEEEYEQYYAISKELTEKLNSSKKYELMIETKNIAHKERNEIDIILRLIRKFYEIKFENIKCNKYSNYEFVEPILEIIDTKDIKMIVKRLKILDNFINDFNYNVNKELFINKLFLIWE